MFFKSFTIWFVRERPFFVHWTPSIQISVTKKEFWSVSPVLNNTLKYNSSIETYKFFATNCLLAVKNASGYKNNPKFIPFLCQSFFSFKVSNYWIQFLKSLIHLESPKVFKILYFFQAYGILSISINWAIFLVSCDGNTSPSHIYLISSKSLLTFSNKSLETVISLSKNL